MLAYHKTNISDHLNVRIHLNLQNIIVKVSRTNVYSGAEVTIRFLKNRASEGDSAQTRKEIIIILINKAEAVS